MNTKSLGRLEKVSLREAWLSESTDFTPWLAQEENLKELGEAIGIELELESSPSATLSVDGDGLRHVGHGMRTLTSSA